MAEQESKKKVFYSFDLVPYETIVGTTKYLVRKTHPTTGQKYITTSGYTREEADEIIKNDSPVKYKKEK